MSEIWGVFDRHGFMAEDCISEMNALAVARCLDISRRDRVPHTVSRIYPSSEVRAILHDMPAEQGDEMSTVNDGGPANKHARGLYAKFNVTRTDGSDLAGGKHENCEYFVLDLTHDHHAIHALRAYACSCDAEYPQLAADLRMMIAAMERKA